MCTFVGVQDNSCKYNMVNHLFSRRVFLVLGIVCCACSMLSAQVKKPSWVQKEPVVKGSYIGIEKMVKPVSPDSIANMESYKRETVRKALWKVADQLPLVGDNRSLLASLIKGDQYKASLDDALLDEMQKSPYFMLVGEWEDETEYYCYVSVKEKAALEFIESMIESKKTRALEMYEEAQSLESEGYLYKAAAKYVEILDSLHPAIFSYLPVPDDTGFVDLGQQIYNSYLDVYKGISMSAGEEKILAVYGEPVPADFSVSITKNGVPLRRLGVIAEFDGTITVSPTTDDEGVCHFSIDNITSKNENQMISLTIDTEYLMDLPFVYGCNAIEGRHLFPSLKIPVQLFNPNAFVKINTAPTDSLLLKNLKTLWVNNRDDVELVERFDSADIIVDIEVGIVKEKDIPTEKYQFVQYNTSLNIKVNGVADNVLLTEYGIKDFKLMLPATRTEAQVRQAALREMIRQMNREFPDYLKKYQFDKREIKWRSLKSKNS